VPQRLYGAHIRAPSGAPSWLEAFTAAEWPGLWSLARGAGSSTDCGRGYNHHGNHTGRYFSSLPPASVSRSIQSRARSASESVECLPGDRWPAPGEDPAGQGGGDRNADNSDREV
jgi:hypothetical protein